MTKVTTKKSPKKTTATKTSPTKETKTATRKPPRPKLLAPVTTTFARLQAAYPDAHCELVHRDAFTLLVATVLSAQATDVSVNKATPSLFSRYPDAESLAAADVADVEKRIATIGMYRQKSKRIVALAKLLLRDNGGEVPGDLDALVKLPGVGRKTANVVLGVWFKTPVGVVVDTHVQRVSQRLAWTKNVEPLTIERDLMKALPQPEWDHVSHVLIFHGRRTCIAQRPACERCAVADVCSVAGRAKDVGRKHG